MPDPDAQRRTQAADWDAGYFSALRDTHNDTHTPNPYRDRETACSCGSYWSQDPGCPLHHPKS